MIRRPPRSTLSSSSAASDVYKRQILQLVLGDQARPVEPEPPDEPVRPVDAAPRRDEHLAVRHHLRRATPLVTVVTQGRAGGVERVGADRDGWQAFVPAERDRAVVYRVATGPCGRVGGRLAGPQPLCLLYTSPS